MQSHLNPVQSTTGRESLGKIFPIYRPGLLKQIVIESISLHFEQTEGKELCDTNKANHAKN